jgi:hypothetical protein
LSPTGGDVLGKAEWVVADNNSPGEDNNASGGDKAAAEHDHIALAIDTLRKDYEGIQSDRSKHDEKTLFWARIAGVGVSIYTLLTLAIVGAAIYSANQAKVSADASVSQAKTADDTERRSCGRYRLGAHFTSPVLD